MYSYPGLAGFLGLPEHLDDHPLAPLAVPLPVEHPLPRPQIELPRGDWNDDLLPDGEAPGMGCGVVLPGLVVAVALRIPGRDGLLPPLEDVVPESRFAVVHGGGCGDSPRPGPGP